MHTLLDCLPLPGFRVMFISLCTKLVVKNHLGLTKGSLYGLAKGSLYDLTKGSLYGLYGLYTPSSDGQYLWRTSMYRQR